MEFGGHLNPDLLCQSSQPDKVEAVPELPEVEVLVRHLQPLLENRSIRAVHVNRGKVVAPASTRRFMQALHGAKFGGLTRRGKYLVFTLRKPGQKAPLTLVGHLGMTGRMYLLSAKDKLPKHAAVVLDLGRENFVFEDTRYFGRLTLETSALARLGPEPLGPEFTVRCFADALNRSRQPIKVRLLDQSLLAGVGNIYASEALFRARIAPTLPARRLTGAQVKRLWRAIRSVLREAIACGSTVPLNYAGQGTRDGLFYFGRAPGAPDYYEERLRVYDRAGQPCPACGTPIKRRVQAARSTFYCPHCQRA
ncbi:MAG: bifunctional DNA-formamidopyrimidine glycosylase/DNA-(apurinic or apyrimidinic site) lyase [Verrucomicrobia bacterium]|nr:bifunctional DNA-formamidopyrimidine glycosylase/DNA-(apurinic or apyrimidinic site) lyase [Verrucomicrobiota bacterium]